MPRESRRSRDASDIAKTRAGDSAGPGSSTSPQREDKSGQKTCYDHIEEAGRLLDPPGSPSTFLPQPQVLDSSGNHAGPVVGWIHDLAFENDLTEKFGLRIELPNQGELRARKLISRSRRVMTGKYPSWKMDRLVHWESRLESKVFRLLDVCQAVEKFSEQPFTIHYLSDESWRSHVPDVAFVDNGGVIWILEVKSNFDPNISEALLRESVIAPRLKCLGFKYAVVKERDIRSGASLSNAEAKQRFGRGEPSAIAHREKARLLAERPSLSRTDLVGRIIDGHHAFNAAAQLALRGEVSLNWRDVDHQPLRIQCLRDENAEESMSWLQRALGVTK